MIPRLVSEAFRTLRAPLRFARYRGRGRSDLGLASLEARPPVARAGEPATYLTAVTDLGDVPRDVRLVLEVRGPQGTSPLRRREVRLRTQPGAARPVELVIDALPAAEHLQVVARLSCEGRPVDDVTVSQALDTVPRP